MFDRHVLPEIRRKCAEADPEAWAEEVDAMTS